MIRLWVYLQSFLRDSDLQSFQDIAGWNDTGDTRVGVAPEINDIAEFESADPLDTQEHSNKKLKEYFNRNFDKLISQTGGVIDVMKIMNMNQDQNYRSPR